MHNSSQVICALVQTNTIRSELLDIVNDKLLCQAELARRAYKHVHEVGKYNFNMDNHYQTGYVMVVCVFIGKMRIFALQFVIVDSW